MNLEELKDILKTNPELNFKIEGGASVPSHFHITEVGQITKNFIDCGGTIRKENKVSLQLWESVDVWHRLKAEKLLKIIEMSQDKVGVENYEIEVEYQGSTIGKYGLNYEKGEFILSTSKTACLAEENCGIPVEKLKKNLRELGQKASDFCDPNSNCC
ncbi:MAG: DUF6428 family protein [Bacteroidota bacterium]